MGDVAMGEGALGRVKKAHSGNANDAQNILIVFETRYLEVMDYPAGLHRDIDGWVPWILKRKPRSAERGGAHWVIMGADGAEGMRSER